jgi:hypothetical protein
MVEATRCDGNERRKENRRNSQRLLAVLPSIQQYAERRGHRSDEHRFRTLSLSSTTTTYYLDCLGSNVTGMYVVSTTGSYHST